MRPRHSVGTQRPAYLVCGRLTAKQEGKRNGERVHQTAGGDPKVTRYYVVEDHADHALATFKTQHEAIEWAKKNGHIAHVARVRHLNDKKKADHWRAA